MFAFFNNQDEPTIKLYPPEFDAKALLQEKTELTTELDMLLENANERLDRWESELNDETVKLLPKDVQKILAIDNSKRNRPQRHLLYRAGVGALDLEYATQWKQRAKIEKTLDDVPSTMVFKERTSPRKTTVLVQGDFTRPSEEVLPGTPAVLHPLNSLNQYPTRLDLAQWIVSRDNPLTARVIVNRVWQQYFGRGIVETENDFGLQGTVPSHPELLDWLAMTLVDSGWDLKKMHREIVLSQTYRQSSNDRLELQQKDPNNDLLGRQRRLRLDAEIIRDVCLSASGLLSSKMGGPPVFPPIPQGVMSQGQVRRDWSVSPGVDRYRRGLYTFVYRSTPPPAFNVFDAPDGLSSCTRRARSNTPLQALTLLNDSAYFEFAQALAAIIRKEGLSYAFRKCTSRFPLPGELGTLEELDPLSAARVLLNLDETVTRG